MKPLLRFLLTFRHFSWCVRATLLLWILLGLNVCAVRDLRHDLNALKEGYGYLKGRVVRSSGESQVMVALFTHDDDGMSIVNLRTVEVGEAFYILVPEASYSLLAFADSNEDFVYQPGEPAVRIDDPLINRFEDLEIQDRLDYEALREQTISLSSGNTLDQKLDLSIGALRNRSKAAANFLGVVTWEDERFSDENIRRGMWEPGAFQNQVGYGLYVLKEFNRNQKAILFVHGINDSPRVFQSLVDQLPSDYQLLLFHFPSGFPLEHTSYILTEAVEQVLRQYAIPQLDVIAHSMGGLVSQGMLYQLDEVLRPRVRTHITMSTPFAGHAAAQIGIDWAPAVAPVWWAMAPNSRYLGIISALDLSSGPYHHLIFSFSHDAEGDSEGDDGVVSVKSQLAYSAQRNVTGIYGVADNHAGVVDNGCTIELLRAILSDGNSKVPFPDC